MDNHTFQKTLTDLDSAVRQCHTTNHHWQRFENALTESDITIELLAPDKIAMEVPYNQQQKRDHLASLITTHKATLLEFLALKRSADHDWQKIIQSPVQFSAYRNACREAWQRELGQTPAHYTGKATCQHCGIVPMPPSFNGRSLLSCLWCFNRVQNKPVPNFNYTTHPTS
ncbi:MAG: hypothetical protein GY821_01795 [Gammaproteobacteria bacterium]|nr:hypothetical protein [Gammaproteobacteria bacterium]